MKGEHCGKDGPDKYCEARQKTALLPMKSQHLKNNNGIRGYEAKPERFNLDLP